MQINLETHLLLQNSDDLGLFVIDEEDSDTLLVHRISTDDIYRRQEGMHLHDAQTSMIPL